MACNTTYTLNQPEFPAVINFEKTGFNGVAQAGSSVRSPWNLITSETNDFASITMSVGAVSAGTIAIYDPISTYPAGTMAGFSVDKVNTLLLTTAQLLSSLTVATYLDGVLQESKNAGGLLDLEVLGILSVTTATDPAFIGFITTKSFDEIRISYLPAVGALSELRVFNALIDTRTVQDIGGLICFNLNADFNVTYPNIATPGNVSTNDRIATPVTYGTAVPDAGNPTGATIVMVSDGSYTFTATTAGVYEYVVPICLAGQTSGCATEKLTITVLDETSSTNPPVANPDYAFVKGDDVTPSSVTVNVRVNDRPGNIAGVLGSPTIPIQPINGTASVDGTSNIVFTPVAGFYGEVTITYQVCESPSALCRTAELVVTVTRANAPNSLTAVDDHITVQQNTTFTSTVNNGVRVNDTDPENDPLTVTPQNTTTSAGTLVLANDGSYTFTPVNGFKGPASYVYTVCDPTSCQRATLYILVSSGNPLPVTLSEFNVFKYENTAQLKWTTVSESNSQYFELQRSEDATSWNVINKQNARGESKGVVNYSFIDNTPLNGSNYYRLKMVDADASFAYSKYVVYHLKRCVSA